MLALLLVLALAYGASAGVYPRTCGVPIIRPTLEGSKIVSNTEAVPNSWPWQVQLRYLGSHYCGGSVLTPNTILTAAHCVFGNSATAYSIRGGRHTRSGIDQYEQSSAARQIVVHESYTSSALDNDVALIYLATPFTLNDYVSPVCLTDSEPQAGVEAWVTGWGNVKGTCCDGKLKQAKLPIVSRSQCSAPLWWGSRITAGMVCAGYQSGYPSGCNGDSGGPLVVLGEGGEFRQVGIVSWGSSTCQADNKPNVYANVNHYKSWITSKIVQLEKEAAEREVRFNPRLGAAFRAFA